MAPRPFLEQYRSNLEEKLRGQEFRQAFEKLKREDPIFDTYPTVEALRNLLSPNNKNYADKDAVMGILLRELKRGNAIYPLINLMFWDSLYRLYRQRHSRVDDYEELFNQIQWNFYQAVKSHDLERLPRKIDVNIFLNSKKKVLKWEKENLRTRDTLRESLDEFMDLSKAGLSPVDLVESTVHPEEMETYLLDMVYRKVITEDHYDLLLETSVHKRMSQKEWAREKGIPHNTTVRTLKHRAEKAIRRFEEKRRFER